MEWADDFTPQQFHDYLSGLERIGQETNWRIGEAIIKQEAKWGTAYDIAETATGYTVQTLWNIVSVVKTFQSYLRKYDSNLKWSHYAIAARIEDHTRRDKLLAIADKESLTIKGFKVLIEGGKTEQHAEDRCSRNGWTLGSLTMKLLQAFGKQPKLAEWRDDFLIAEEYGIRPSLGIHAKLVTEIERRGIQAKGVIEI